MIRFRFCFSHVDWKANVFVRRTFIDTLTFLLRARLLKVYFFWNAYVLFIKLELSNSTVSSDAKVTFWIEFETGLRFVSKVFSERKVVLLTEVSSTILTEIEFDSIFLLVQRIAFALSGKFVPKLWYSRGWLLWTLLWVLFYKAWLVPFIRIRIEYLTWLLTSLDNGVLRGPRFA